jgi:filamentous hemagglutinin
LIDAGRDLTLNSATESDYSFFEETKTKKGFLSKTTTHTVREDYATQEKGTLLSGDNVSLSAGNDLTVKGSSVVGDGKVNLQAGKNVGGRGHVEKAQTYSKALQAWLNKNPQASSSDRAAAENVLKDMQNALKGK